MGVGRAAEAAAASKAGASEGISPPGAFGETAAPAPTPSPAVNQRDEATPRFFPWLADLFWGSEPDEPGQVGGEEGATRDPAQEIVLASAIIPEVDPATNRTAAIEGLPEGPEQPEGSTAEDVPLASVMWDDWCNFYSPPSLVGLGLGIGVAAILANSDLDFKIQYDGQHDARFDESDEWSSVTKTMGEGYVVLPIYLSAMIVDSVFREDFRGGLFAVWGERSLRATAVGAPMMVLLQRTLGASRPDEDPTDSRWSFWADDNGVSGHAFMGAIPFLTAAKMTDNPWMKTAFLGGSVAVAWSRLNDNNHFPSQVAMGWWLAFLATTAVDETDLGNDRWRLVPMPVPDGIGISLEYQR
jgi:hypothetical protein